MSERTTQDEYREFIAKRHLNELTNEDDIKIIKRIFETHAAGLWLDPNLGKR